MTGSSKIGENQRVALEILRTVIPTDGDHMRHGTWRNTYDVIIPVLEFPIHRCNMQFNNTAASGM